MDRTRVAEEGMQQGKALMAGFLAVCLLLVGGTGFAQAKPAIVPDAQIEANVLKALAGAPELADQAIKSTTVYGTVTLSGSVRDEPSRDLAEKLVSNASGVQKVVDELTISVAAVAQDNNPPDQDPSAGTNPNLQSDGTMAPATQGQTSGQVPQNQNATAPPAPPQGNAPPQAGQYPPAANQQPYGQPYPGPYGAPPPGYGQQPRPYVEQRGGDPVVVPAGTMVRVRVNQAMDSKKTPPGTVFDGVVLSDVFAGGYVAIPRGAMVQGTVVDSHTAGELKGHGELSLQLTQVMLGGRSYPVATNRWLQQGVDKTGNTVGNTVGLGAVGALIGAVAGGGVGAAVGAGVGGVAGLGVSSASRAGEVVIPSEAILNFQLAQPVELTTVSQAELNRLGSAVPPPQVPPMMQVRHYPPPPPPPPYYYGPVYYPYPR
jgi:hypothetical protein